MAVLIAGIGTAVPTHRIRQEDAAEIAQQYSCENEAQSRLFKSIYRRAGVNTRHSVVLESSAGDLKARQSFYAESNPTTEARMRRYEDEAISLALAAAARALDDAAMAPDRVTHLVTVSCSGFYAPGVDIALMKRLPLPARVCRAHIGFMGCQGVLNGLRVARAFLDQDPRACVLVLAQSRCAAFIISTVGIPIVLSQTPCSPMVRRHSSAWLVRPGRRRLCKSSRRARK